MPFDKKITSFSNAKIKALVAHREKKTRDQTGMILVEGVREIERALEAGLVLRELYVCVSLLEEDILKRFTAPKVIQPDQIYEVSSSVIEKISYGERNEGALALFQRPQLSLKELDCPKDDPLIVVVENVEKPGNLGAILRTCDGAGVDALIVCDNQTDCYNPNVIRSSLGTIFTVPVMKAANEEALAFLKENKVKVMATVPNASNVYTNIKLTGPLAVVLGSEQQGLSHFWIKNSDHQVRIPMLGKVDSLNVSATAAVLIYEVLRQRS